MQPTIYFAADHAGFSLKQELLKFVRDELAYDVRDCGAFVHDENDDFTDFVSKAAAAVHAHPQNTKAIILGGSGQGEAMLANRFTGVRAAVYYGGSEKIVMLSRVHNNANVLSLGARFLEVEAAKKAVTAWLLTPYSPVEKYDRRNAALDAPLDMGNSQLGAQAPSTQLVPSIPAASFAEIDALLQALNGVARGVQIDIVDGVFVPHTSWPFTQENIEIELLRLKPYCEQFEIEIDCMCMHPEQYLDLFAAIGVRRVVVHMGSTNAYETCIAHAQTHAYKIGFAVTNDTDLELLKPYEKMLDFVQVMGIKNIGIQNQPFDERTTETIAAIRKLHPHMEIAVDGAVNESTLLLLKEAGANRFAPGSAITQTADQKEAYKQLADMIGL